VRVAPVTPPHLSSYPTVSPLTNPRTHSHLRPTNTGPTRATHQQPCDPQTPGPRYRRYLTFGTFLSEADLRSPTQTPQTNVITGRRYFTYSGNAAKARPGSLPRDDAGKPRWAIWTRENFEVHRYPYASEAEARRDFAKWVYVRILTSPHHAEIEVNSGWHAAPLIPLTDIRAAIAANR